MTNSMKSIDRRKAAQLIMGVAALGLALGKKQVAAKELTTAYKWKNMTAAEKSVFIKLSAEEQSYYIKLSALERSTFIKHQADWDLAEKSSFLKLNAKD